MPSLVFLFDVDNTLLDTDRVTADFKAHLSEKFGAAANRRYWEIFEDTRNLLGYADYLEAIQKYRLENESDQRLMEMSSYLLDYPFAERLFPGAASAVAHVRRFGVATILSDGDVIFQPRKVERSGLRDLFGGNVMIFLHKEEHLEYIESHYPAEHYVMIDDKVRLLDAVKRKWGRKVTTIFPRQGHYAHDQKAIAAHSRPDHVIETIGDLVTLGADDFLQV
ncbi:HAD family hydrolase [Kamptonema cortianum]|nr:HAD family hydrolase [Oscillatoria laete-virens]MDK3157185.1 HAD family hydrolase [Kamptonema cortianum]MDL5054436.1 HAD family hydrolase [Oscillatoria laete-virens NRMC-F 0139]